MRRGVWIIACIAVLAVIAFVTLVQWVPAHTPVPEAPYERLEVTDG